MKSKLLLNKFHATLAAGLLTASFVVAPSTQAADWAGGNGNWSSTVSPGWTVGGVPNAVGAVANHGNSNTSITTVDIAVTVGTISLTNNSNHAWNFGLTSGITLDQDGAGSGNATISNTNTFVGTANGLTINTGTLTLADNLLISNTGASTRGGAAGGSISFASALVIAGTGNITIDNVLNDIAGVGAITFYGGSSTFTGNVNVRSGGTVFNGASAFGNAANVITLGASGAGSASLFGGAAGTFVNNWVVAAGSGGTLTMGSNGLNAQTWSGTGTLNGDLTLFTLANSSNKFKLDGVISGTGNFTMSSSGAGYAEMSQANTYSGSTKVSSGILSLTSTNALQNSALDTTNSVTGTTTAGLRAGGVVTTLTLGGLTGNKNLADVFATGASSSAGRYSSLAALTLNPGTGVTHTYSAAIANGAANMTLTKTGNGTQELSGTNTYTGATTISAGTLLINGNQSGATGAVAVNNAATLGGNGTVGGIVTVGSGGILSPGNSPGLQNMAGLVLNNGGNYNWQVLDATGVAGTGYDIINLSGSLNLASLTGATDYQINLWSLSSIGPDVNGNATNFNNALNQSWTLVSTGNVITGFDATEFTVNVGANAGANGFTNALAGGAFSVDLSVDSTDLMLVYTAIPEPSTFALLGLGLTTVMVFRRRRQS